MRLLPLVLILLLASCGGRSSPGDEKPLQPLKPIRYHRSGGLAGTSDHITISSTGTVQVTGRLFGESSTVLSEFQMMQLARIFEGWEKLQDHYPAPPGAADDFVTEIRYGDKTVTASDAAPDLPPRFLLARDRLESLIRNLPPK